MIRLRSIQITPDMSIGSGLGRCGLLRRGRCLRRPGRFKFWRRARFGRRPVCLGRRRGVSDRWRVGHDGQWHHHSRGLASRSGALFGAGTCQRRLGAASRRGKRERGRTHHSDTSQLTGLPAPTLRLTREIEQCCRPCQTPSHRTRRCFRRAFPFRESRAACREPQSLEQRLACLGAVSRHVASGHVLRLHSRQLARYGTMPAAQVHGIAPLPRACRGALRPLRDILRRGQYRPTLHSSRIPDPDRRASARRPSLWPSDVGPLPLHPVQPARTYRRTPQAQRHPPPQKAGKTSDGHIVMP